MKTVLVFGFLSLFSFSIKAQTVVVAVDKMNVFYVGLNNPVAIAVEGVADEKLKVSSDNGQITKTERGHYNAILERAGTCNITVEWDGQKIIKPFRVKAIPNPRIVVGERDGTYIYAGSFNGMIALIVNFDINASCSVVSYTCTLASLGGDVKSVKVIGPMSPEVSTLLDTAKKGDKVIFSDIAVRCPGDLAPRLYKEIITRIVQ